MKYEIYFMPMPVSEIILELKEDKFWSMARH
jgi:hypothetical protein